MRKLLILGADFTTEYVIKYCKENQIYSILAALKDKVDQKFTEMADEYWDVSYDDINELEKRCLTYKVNGIFSGSSENALDNVKKLTKKLNLPFYASDKSWEVARDKRKFKKVCEECGLTTPKEYVVDDMTSEQLKGINYPVVFKPLNSTGSRGVKRCNNYEELVDTYKIFKESSPSNRALVEEYIDGNFYSMFFLADKGQYYLINAFEQRKVPMKNEEFYSSYALLPAPSNSEIDRIMKNEISKLFQKIEFNKGVFFVQLIYSNNKCYFIESGCRIDGVKAWQVAEDLYGFNLIKWMINLSLGIDNEETIDNFYYYEPKKKAVVAPIYVKPGKIDRIEGFDIIDGKNYFLVFQRYFSGDVVKDTASIEQIMFSIYVICNDFDEGNKKLDVLYDSLKVYDNKNQNMLIKPNSFIG